MSTISLAHKAVLGIDAAWTEHGASAVALAVLDGKKWKLVHIAPGYESFMSEAPGTVDWSTKRQGKRPNAKDLLHRAEELAGTKPGVISLDMPIVPQGRVNGRRNADDAVSKEFGRYLCAVHSPTKDRPGGLGESLSHGFEQEGYRVAVSGDTCSNRDIVEVYPHATMVRLTCAKERLKYKVSKTKKYWPTLSLNDRAQKLSAAFQEILSAIRKVMVVPPKIFDLPPELTPPLSGLKAFEDGLDALVCVWAGICFVEGKADAFGDKTGTIWI